MRIIPKNFWIYRMINLQNCRVKQKLVYQIKVVTFYAMCCEFTQFFCQNWNKYFCPYFYIQFGILLSYWAIKTHYGISSYLLQSKFQDFTTFLIIRKISKHCISKSITPSIVHHCSNFLGIKIGSFFTMLKVLAICFNIDFDNKRNINR